MFNPEYSAYTKQDSAIASWLLTSNSSLLLPNIFQCSKSHEIWNRLRQLLYVESTTHVMRLLLSLQSQRKRDVPMHGYLGKIQLLCDNLKSSDHPIFDTMQSVQFLLLCQLNMKIQLL